MSLRLSLEALQVLDAIERKGSFAGAAAELHRVPSALTYQMQKLEQDLDVPLFDRRGHRAALTPIGRELLNEGRHLLRAAVELECRVKRLASGWETDLRIAVDASACFTPVLDLVERFYDENHGTRIRLIREVLGGTWEALTDNRADLIIGATGDGPPGGGFSSHVLGEIEWAFVVAPDHPLANEQEPISREACGLHRVVAVADSSRRLPARTSGVLGGQDVITVDDLETKIDAQRRGLGCGFLPLYAIRDALKRGELVRKEVEEEKPAAVARYAWRTGESGKALKWFAKALDDKALRAALTGAG